MKELSPNKILPVTVLRLPVLRANNPTSVYTLAGLGVVMGDLLQITAYRNSSGVETHCLLPLDLPHNPSRDPCGRLSISLLHVLADSLSSRCP